MRPSCKWMLIVSNGKMYNNFREKVIIKPLRITALFKCIQRITLLVSDTKEVFNQNDSAQGHNVQTFMHLTL